MGEPDNRGFLFRTDGVRGVAGQGLTAVLALDLSVAAAVVLGQPGAGRPGTLVAVIGRDPRASGDFLEAAAVAGLASAGVDVLRVGVIPTPGVAYLIRALGAAFGVVISASQTQQAITGSSSSAPAVASCRTPWRIRSRPS